MKNRIWVLLVALVLTACQVSTATPTESSKAPSIQATEQPALPTATSEPTAAPTPAGESAVISAVSMVDANTGWAAGKTAGSIDDHVLFTTDGGSTWQVREPAGFYPDWSAAASSYRAARVFALDAQHIWAAPAVMLSVPADGNFVVWRSVDGGTTWTGSAPLDFSNMTMDYFSPDAPQFRDADHGWLMAHMGVGMMKDYISIFTTSDGGATWTRVVNPMDNTVPNSCQKTGLVFSSDSDGWLTGNCGGVVPTGVYFYHTTDGGATWSQVSLPAPAEQPDAFTNENRACGARGIVSPSAGDIRLAVDCRDMNNADSKGWIFQTSDNGATWTSHLLPSIDGTLEYLAPQSYWQLPVYDPSTGNVSLQASTDGGVTWTEASSLAWSGALQFVDPMHGWGVTANSDTPSLYRTTDGATWELLSPVIVP
jgi:photosystem II stability/assembly factor-like uncharacterized protein